MLPTKEVTHGLNISLKYRTDSHHGVLIPVTALSISIDRYQGVLKGSLLRQRGIQNHMLCFGELG